MRLVWLRAQRSSMLTILSDLSLLIPDLQAGGGGRFGSGAGGFGGGGGHGDGLGVIFYFLIRLVIEAPLIGVPLLIAAVVIFLKSSQKGLRVHRRGVIRRGAPLLVAGRSAGLAREIRANDGSFDDVAFLARVRNAFLKIQDSWCTQELAPIQHFVSDGVFERFCLQIKEQGEEGWRQGMDELSAGLLSLVHLEQGLHFDTLTVQIPFTADIHRLDLKDGSRLRGSKIARDRFEECWSFVRRRGAKSIAGQGLIEGQCPNCGAPLTINQAGHCDSCQAHVRSGEFDWVLTEITQASEWRREAEEELPGLLAYAQNDPGFSVQMLEDRASLAFWRKCAADRRGNSEALVRVATDGFLRSYNDNLSALPGRDRFYSAENAVGSVRTLGVLSGANVDRAVVEMLYDGCRAEVDEKGRRKVESARRLQRSLFVFERAAGLATSIEQAFTSAICPNCGAHDAGGSAARCPYCEAPRTGDDAAWLLADIVVDRTPAAYELRAELDLLLTPAKPQATQPAPAAGSASSADLLSWAAALAQADGTLDGRERMALKALAQQLGVSSSRLEEMLEEGGDGSAVPSPRDNLEARHWIRVLLRLALASGPVNSSEWRFLKGAAGRFGLSMAEYERILRQEERALSAATKRARREGA